MSRLVAKKPLLLFTGMPADGHMGPLFRIASDMKSRGYDIAFLTSHDYESKTKALGGEFFYTPSIPETVSPDFFQEAEKLSKGLPRNIYIMINIFVRSLAPRAQKLQDALETIKEREPQRQIIIVHEIGSMSVLPFMYGRPLPKGFTEFPKTICINVTCLYVRSRDTAQFWLGLPPDSSESGRARNEVINRLMLEGPLKPLNEAHDLLLKEAGATRGPEGFACDSWITSYDVTFQMCSSSLEYPLSDLHPSVKFAGCLPKGQIDPNYNCPEWWPEIIGKGRKKVVFVCQGTVNMDWNELVVPTMTAFSHSEDVIVVVALGLRGGALPDDMEIPPNARVIDYLLYDVILPYADVFVSNGGYGAFVHAVMNGTPTVFAGESEDKLEVALRAARAGFAINLGTQTPTPEKVREGVDAILVEPRYKARVMELLKENEDMDALSRIERQIADLTH